MIESINQVTRAIIDAAIEVHRRLGPDCSNRSIMSAYAENYCCVVFHLNANGLCRLSTKTFAWNVATGSIYWLPV